MMPLLACLLTACSGSPTSADLGVGARLDKVLTALEAQPSEVLEAPCADPIDLRGMQGLNAGPVERYWIVDRSSLVDCRDRKAAMQKFFRERDAAIVAPP